MGPPPSLPPAPLPSLPPVPPSGPLIGVLALKGADDNPLNGECIISASATAVADATKIAGQCCTSSGASRRRCTDSGGFSTNNTDCIAGVHSEGSFVEMT